jgi:hypothetical protein
MFYATGFPGWARRLPSDAASSPGDNVSDLNARANWLKGQLESIQARIEQLTKA